MRESRAITLPHGCFAAGEHHRDAELRPLCGADEAFLLSAADTLSVAERVSELLDRCLIRVGRGGPDAPATARELTAGDREALLLHLRAVVFGERLPCLLDCPACGEAMDLDLELGDLLVAPYASPRAHYDRSFGTNGTRCDVRFRLPVGADQEAAAAEADVEAGVRVLAERCVESVRTRGRPIAGLPEALIDELSDALARLDPQAELLLRLSCPACARPVVARVDAAAVLFSELAGSEAQLVGEVHALAATYHWSEREILGLDLRRRRLYLDLLGDAATAGAAW